MNSLLVRANAIFCYSLLMLAALAGCNIASTWWLPASPQVEFEVTSIQMFQRQPNTQNDVLSVTFDLQANLSSLFHWNTKQLFVFITAQYATEKNALNQVVLWDDIIRGPHEATLNYKDARLEYSLIDQGHALRGTNATFFFSWDVTPISGVLQRTSMGEHSVTLPSEYLIKPHFLRQQGAAASA